MTEPDQIPAFLVTVTTLPKDGFPADLEADAAEREQIARFCNVAAITSLEAQLLVTRWRRDGVRVAGRLRATVEQPCVVSLETLVQEIDEPVDNTFLPLGSLLARIPAEPGGELLLDPEGDDAPEPFEGTQIDLWQVVVEALILAVDPWPKAQDAVMASGNSGNEGLDDADPSPFAALSALKTGKNG